MDKHDDRDWYLQDWAALADKRQADLVNDLGWLKNHAHRIWHGKQPYRRDIVNAVSTWLNIEPYELLLPPQDALALRALRSAAQSIVDSTPLAAAAAASDRNRQNAKKTK